MQKKRIMMFKIFLDLNSLHFLYFAYPVQSLKKSTSAALEILQICPFPYVPH